MKRFLIISVIFGLVVFSHFREAQTQTRVIPYSSWLERDSVNVQLDSTDTDTVFFPVRALSNVDAAENSVDPPDAVFFGGAGNIVVYPDTAGDGDNESDSLEVWYKPLDEDGQIIYAPKSWCNFAETKGVWSTTQKIVNWSQGTAYGASIAGSLSPCFGIAVFIRQYTAATSGGDTTTVGVKFIRD